MERKHKKVKKSRLIKVRLTAIDAAIVKRKADATGLSISEYVRRTVFGRVIKLKDPETPNTLKHYQILAETKIHLLRLNKLLDQKQTPDLLLMKDNEKILTKIENQLNSSK